MRTHLDVYNDAIVAACRKYNDLTSSAYDLKEAAEAIIDRACEEYRDALHDASLNFEAAQIKIQAVNPTKSANTQEESK
jgi:hypothetical protein